MRSARISGPSRRKVLTRLSSFIARSNCGRPAKPARWLLLTISPSSPACFADRKLSCQNSAERAAVRSEVGWT